MFKLPTLSKKERSWVLYDVANSAFVLTVITVLFPLYHYNKDLIDGVPLNYISIFAFITSGIALTTAILSPIFGALANYRGNKKKFFKIFLGVGLIGGLGLAIPGLQWLVLMAIFIVASVGYNLSNVLYDAFLVDVTTDEKYDEVSSLGFGWGYIGSMIPFFIAIVPFALISLGKLDDQYMQVAISYAFVVVFLWWFFYSLPIIKNVEQTYSIEKTGTAVSRVKGAFVNLARTFKEIRSYKNIFVFMIAYLLYIDVVNTVIRLATTIGNGLHVGDTTLLGVVILVQFIAWPCAILFGRMTKRFGGKKMLYYGIGMYAITIFVVFQIQEGTEWLMWIVAFLVGSAQGGIQAVSRSFFAKMVPKEKVNEFFGFFSVFGKFSGIFSPFLIGVLVNYMDMRYSVLFLLIPLTLGSIVLGFVKSPEKKVNNNE